MLITKIIVNINLKISRPMECTRSNATTEKLLDSAIAAAKSAIKSNVKPPELTSTRWLWRLAGFYHLCHPIPRLVKQAKKKFAAQKRWRLANWAEKNAQEEAGHDLLALKDIESLGSRAIAYCDSLLRNSLTLL